MILNIKIINIISIVFMSIYLLGCSNTITHKYKSSGKEVICEGGGLGIGDRLDLGNVAILPETAWRIDQKDPEDRKLMASKEIKNSFSNFPCGTIAESNGIREFSNWSSKTESKLLNEFSNNNIDTIIIIRIEELTPRFYFTFSLPVLWSGSNEVDLHIRALSVKTGNVIADMRIKRTTGGPFNIRPAEWSRNELKAALDSVIK